MVIGFIFTLYFEIYQKVIPKISQNNGKVNDDVLEIKIDDCDRDRAELIIYTRTCYAEWTIGQPFIKSINPYVVFVLVEDLVMKDISFERTGFGIFFLDLNSMRVHYFN